LRLLDQGRTLTEGGARLVVFLFLRAAVGRVKERGEEDRRRELRDTSTSKQHSISPLLDCLRGGPHADIVIWFDVERLRFAGPTRAKGRVECSTSVTTP